jgi:hypothetical protein
MRAIGFHFLLLAYHQGCFYENLIFIVDIGHPSIMMQRENFVNFNGEDIELASRELAQSQLSVRGREDVSLFFVISVLDQSC